MPFKKGHVVPPEVRAKISAKLKGVPKPPGIVRRKPVRRTDLPNHWLGRKHSPESIEKMRAVHTGVLLPEEQKRKIGDALRGQKRKGINNAIHYADGFTEITLTQGKSTFIDTEDWPLVSQHRWRAHKIVKPNFVNWYASAKSPAENGRSKTLFLHALLLPDAPLADHKDGDGLNNRRSNLRPANASQNNINRRPTPHSSQFLGVFWNTRKSLWQAKIGVYGKSIHLGFFKSESDAGAARRAAEDLYFPGFSRSGN